MGDKIPSPHIEGPPPLPPQQKYSNMAMLYYGLVIIGTAALVLAMYNIIIIRWCTHRRRENSGRRLPQLVEATTTGGSQSFQQSNNSLLSSFKFKKENMVGIENGGEFECAVCLSVLEEGEEVRQLPGCKHSFHASCIDMWLYSHSDCPLCRARVQPPMNSFCRRIPVVAAANTAPENLSREHFAGAAANAHFIPLL